MSEDGGGPPQKKRRVTKACDVCRKKRIKCDTYPDARDGSPCKICVESGIANQCTFSRPSKKRGPAAGRAKELDQTCRILEQLLGFLFSTHPGLDIACEAFLADGMPNADSYRQAYTNSTLPNSVNNVPEDNSPGPSKLTSHRRESHGGASSLEVDLSSWHDSAPVASTSTAAYSNVSPLPAVSAQFPSLGLHTLADAAFQDTANRSRLFSSSNPKRPPLPDESMRNTLLDLYFNLIVQPTFPMLDKNKFFRWTAQPERSEVSPYLYNAVFAVVTSFIPPDQRPANLPSSEDYADAARAEMYLPSTLPTIEGIQTCVLLAIYDWGQDELNRAWLLSSIAVALSITIGLHHSRLSQRFYVSSDPNCERVNTFHAVMTLHTILCLRLMRPSLIRVEDYSAPPAPHDGAENFELWRSDMSPDDLRRAYGLPLASSSTQSNPMYPSMNNSAKRTQPVRSSAQTTFSQLVLLCSLGGHVLRYHTSQVQDSEQVKEQKRSELVQVLQLWEADLPTDLRIGRGAAGTEKVPERPRHVVDLHLILLMLYQKLVPSPTYEGSAYDPSPHAASLTAHIFSLYLETFTCLRSLPLVEGALDAFFDYQLMSSPPSSVKGNSKSVETVLRMYDELGCVWKIGRNKAQQVRKRFNLRAARRPPTAIVSSSSAADDSAVPPRISTPLRDLLESSSSTTNHHSSSNRAPLDVERPSSSLIHHLEPSSSSSTTSHVSPSTTVDTPMSTSTAPPAAAQTASGAQQEQSLYYPPAADMNDWSQRDLLVSLGLVMADNVVAPPPHASSLTSTMRRPSVSFSLDGPPSSNRVQQDRDHEQDANMAIFAALGGGAAASSSSAFGAGAGGGAETPGWLSMPFDLSADKQMGDPATSGPAGGAGAGHVMMEEDRSLDAGGGGDAQDVLMLWLERGHIA